MLFQDDALLPWKTARDNVALGLTFNGMERSKALAEAEAWLERLGLAGFGDRFPRHLSGGQRKRVAHRAGAGDEAETPADGRAVRLARRDRARPHRAGRRRAGRARSASAFCSSPTISKRRSASPTDVYLLSQGPRARITQQYQVPIPRPRDPVQSRVHPAFAPLYEKLWEDLSHEVDFDRLAEAAE